MTLAGPQLLAAGSALGLTLLAAYSIACDLVLRDRGRVGRRIDEAFIQRQRERTERTLLFKDLAKLAEDVTTDAPSLRRRFEAMVDQSGLRTQPRTVLTIAVGIGVVAAVIAGSSIGPVGVLPAAAGGFLLPIWRVRVKRDARREKLRSQLPDAFDLMARAVRSGQTMQQAFIAVADEFASPIAEEFSLCSEQQNLGLSTEDSYADLAERTGLVELKLFVTGALVQQQTGGNVTELLERLSSLLRDRARIRGVVKTLTAEGRLQAILLMALPPGLFVVMLGLNASYARLLFTQPKLIWGTIGLEILGALWIRKIINFDF